MMDFRECTECGEVKDYSEFHYRRKQGCYRHKCKVCRRENHYDYNLQRRYGITLKEKVKMFENQGKCCAICGQYSETHRSFHVDHCHSTMEIRGILCNNCNAGLGMFNDNPDTLDKALEYLTK
jgi:hypothetical protein